MKKVDILWKDSSSVSTSRKVVSGELYIRVLMSDTCDRSRFWTVLKNDCLQLMEMIDWKRSYPEDIQAATSALGIDFAKTQFMSVSSYYVGLELHLKARLYYYSKGIIFIFLSLIACLAT